MDDILGSAATRGTVNFNGTGLCPGPDFTGGPLILNLTHAYIGANGLKIEIGESQEASIAQELAHSPEVGSRKDGGLTKEGAGTLLLDQPTSYTDLSSWYATVEVMLVPVGGSCPLAAWDLHSFRLAGASAGNGFLRLEVSEVP